MNKLSFSLLVVLFSCYLAFVSADQSVFRPAGPCPTGRVMCTMIHRPYCIKYVDGTIREQYGNGCHPCGSQIAGYYVGKCEKSFLGK